MFSIWLSGALVISLRSTHPTKSNKQTERIIEILFKPIRLINSKKVYFYKNILVGFEKNDIESGKYLGQSSNNASVGESVKAIEITQYLKYLRFLWKNSFLKLIFGNNI